MQDPQPNGPTIDPCTGTSVTDFPIQDRTESPTRRIYDADAPSVAPPSGVATGTVLCIKYQFVEWIECRHGGGSWHRATPDLAWHLRKTCEYDGSAWRDRNTPVPTSVVAGFFGGTAGESMNVPGAPCPMTPAGIAVSVGGTSVPSTQWSYDAASGELKFTQPGSPGGVEVSFDRPAFNDIGPGTIELKF